MFYIYYMFIIIHWILIGGAGGPQLLVDVSNNRIQIHPFFKLSFNTLVLIWATATITLNTLLKITNLSHNEKIKGRSVKHVLPNRK